MKDVDITVSIDPVDVLCEMNNDDIYKYLKDEYYFTDEIFIRDVKENFSLINLLNCWFDRRGILNKEDIINLVKEELG